MCGVLDIKSKNTSKENINEDDKTLYKNKVYEILNNKRDKSKRLNLIKNILQKFHPISFYNGLIQIRDRAISL